jgi:hypothetical protein
MWVPETSEGNGSVNLFPLRSGRWPRSSASLYPLAAIRDAARASFFRFAGISARAW